MPALQINQLHKSYRHGVLPVLEGVDFALGKGQICAIVGESGSGKSTFLKLIAGLEAPDQGTIIIDGKAVSSSGSYVPPEKRQIGFVFQDFALFPHLTVDKNVGFGLPRGKASRDRVEALLGLIGLTGHGAKYPHELSGGEQQRVALARAMAPNPKILLLDEPFSNLDVGIKKAVRAFVFDIIRSSNLTCVFVTHDLDDAMMYADVISILHKGRIEQTGSPEALYANPKNAYIAGFFGDINVLCDKTTKRLGLDVPTGTSCGVRACHVDCIADSNTAVHNGVPVRVLKKVYMGNHECLAVETEDGCRLDLELPAGQVTTDDAIYISVDPSNLLMFS